MKTFNLSASFDVLHVQGEKAQAFLQSQLTNDVHQVNEQQLQWQAYCNRQGLVQSIFGLWGEKQDFYLLVTKDLTAITQALLEKYGVFSKIHCGKLTPEITLELIPAAEKNLTWRIASFTAEKIKFVWQTSEVAIASANEAAQILILRQLFIHHHFPWLCQATSNLFRPHDLSLPELGLVSFQKGCFPGQEIIARMQYRGKPKQGLYVLTLQQEKVLQPGQAILLAEKNIGQVVDAIALNDGTAVSAVLLHEYANYPAEQFFS